MTLNALALEMIRAHRENAADTDYVAQVEQWILDALNELALVTNWRAFKTNTTLATVASQQMYTLPTRVRDVRFISEPDTETFVSFIPKERIALLGIDLEQEGRPQFWFYNDQENVTNDFRFEIGFAPIPDAIYTLDVAYDTVPTSLATGDHIPVQSNMILALKHRVRSYMCLDDKDVQLAEAFYQQFTSVANLLRDKENRPVADRTRLQPRDIPGRGGDRRFARLDPNRFS